MPIYSQVNHNSVVAVAPTTSLRDLTSPPWYYHPSMNRLAAEKHLLSRNMREGDFVIRSKSQDPDSYVLTRCGCKRFYHLVIHKTEQKKRILQDSDVEFDEVIDLINYFQIHPHRHLCPLIRQDI